VPVQALAAVEEKTPAAMTVSKATIPRSFFIVVLLFPTPIWSFGASRDVRWITSRKAPAHREV
jgi:hypothetical protein